MTAYGPQTISNEGIVRLRAPLECGGHADVVIEHSNEPHTNVIFVTAILDAKLSDNGLADEIQTRVFSGDIQEGKGGASQALTDFSRTLSQDLRRACVESFSN